jgi:hypothetical protein
MKDSARQAHLRQWVSRVDNGLILKALGVGELNENSDQIATLDLGHCIGAEFIRTDLRVSRLFHGQRIFPGIEEAPKSASVVLVSLVCDLLSRGPRHDSMAVPYTSQALRQTVEIKLIHYPP